MQFETMSLACQNRLAQLAHLTALVNLISGVGGVLLAIGMFLFYRKRSIFVAFHALQAAIFQLIFWVGGALLALLFWLGSAWLSDNTAFGFCSLPLAFLVTLIPLAALVYTILAALDVRVRHDYQYPIIGNWALKLLSRM